MQNDPSVRPVLARKISFRFLLISLASLAVVIVIFFAFALPALVDSTLSKCSYVAEAAENQFDNQLQDMVNVTQMLTNTGELSRSLSGYRAGTTEAEQYAAGINLLLTGYTGSRQVCRRIVLDDMNGTLFSSIGQQDANDDVLLASPGYADILQNNKHMWICPLYQSSDSGGYTLALSRKETIAGRPCIITAFSDATNLFTYIEGMTATFFDDVAFYDLFGNLLYATDNTDMFAGRDSVPDVYHYTDHIDTTSRDHFITAVGNRNRSIFIGYASTLTLFKDFQSYFLAVLVCFIAALLFTMLLLLPMIRHKLSPLLDLTTAMRSIQEGHTESRVQIDTNDEIGDLGRMYNTMLDTLEQNTEDLLENEREKDRLKYSLLISQIDPHFIFNTMNIITSLARQNRNEEIIEINAALIHLLQDRLRITPTEVLDSVEHEIFITKEYIKIVQIRTGMDVTFVWNCPDDLLDTKIPKNILQPIIENSIKHGLYNIEDGTISGTVRTDISFEPSCDLSSGPSCDPSSDSSRDPSSGPSGDLSSGQSSDSSSGPSCDPSSGPSCDPSSGPSCDPSSGPSCLQIIISDDGTGFSEEALAAFENTSSHSPDDTAGGMQEASRGKHIGLRNIADRLRYLYPDTEDLLSVSNLEPHGTAVRLRIPL